MVGHTHEDVDQMFSRISACLAKQSATTLLSLHENIHKAFTPEPVTIDMSNIWDVKSWLKPMIPTLKNHSRPHAFRFKKANEGHVEMVYRNWSKAGKKEWRPPTPIRILESMPEGAPAIFRPEYSKCPTTEELERGVQQLNSRLSPSEENWWNNFIEKERKERATWETLSDKDLQTAGDSSFSLIDLKYQSIVDTTLETNDEAAKKRMAEVERLLDKNEHFPDIKATKKKLDKKTTIGQQ